MTELPRARPESADCPASVEVGGRSPLPWEQTDGALKSVLARPRCTSFPVPLPAPLRPPHGSQISPVYTRAAASCQGSPCCAGQDRWLPAQGSEEVTGGWPVFCPRGSHTSCPHRPLRHRNLSCACTCGANALTLFPHRGFLKSHIATESSNPLEKSKIWEESLRHWVVTKIIFFPQ